jgi:hypothetical protein
MSYLDAPDANAVVTYAAGALATIPAGPWTIAVIFRRTGTTTDGYENLFALETSGNQVITNLGTDATTSPYALSCGQGGASRTFAGMDDLVDADDYLYIVRKTNGTVDPRANLYRFDEGSPAWDGWVTGAGSGDFENRGDTIDHAKSHNQQGGFPLRGGIYLIAVWDDALDEADVTDGSTGLHVGVQQWLDIALGVGPVTLLRPGEADPIVDESASGTSDETGRSGTLNIETGWPVGFNGDFGGGGSTGTIAATLPALAGDLTGTATGSAALASNLPALAADLAATATSDADLAATLPQLAAAFAADAATAGTIEAELPAITASLSGSASATVSLTGGLPPLTASITADLDAATALTASLPELTAALTGTAGDTASGALDAQLPALAGSLAGAAAADGAIAAALPALTGSFDLGAAAAAVLAALLPALQAELIEVAPAPPWPPIVTESRTGRLTTSSAAHRITTQTGGRP